MYTNACKDRHNNAVIESQQKAGVAIRVFIAEDEVLGISVSNQHKERLLASVQKKKRSDTGQLPQEIKLCVGIPVEFTFNMDKADVLINGSFGTVKAIDDADTVWVRFSEARVGKKVREHNPQHPQHIHGRISLFEFCRGSGCMLGPSSISSMLINGIEDMIMSALWSLSPVPHITSLWHTWSPVCQRSCCLAGLPLSGAACVFSRGHS